MISLAVFYLDKSPNRFSRLHVLNFKTRGITFRERHFLSSKMEGTGGIMGEGECLSGE